MMYTMATGGYSTKRQSAVLILVVMDDVHDGKKYEELVEKYNGLNPCCNG